MIEVSNLSKYYGPHLALDEVTFRVEPGQILGLLGPNGAGKSTCMRILTGYFPPSGGTARIAGFDAVERSRDVRRRIGYLPENVPLYGDHTPYRYLEFVAAMKGVDDVQAEIERVTDVARIEEVANRPIGRLSKGYRQRVGLAQALLGDPPILILDEPTAGLDPRQIIEVRELIRSLGGSHTVILSTHILPEVSMTCGAVVIINQGRVVAVDTPEKLNRRLVGADRITLTVRGPVDEIVDRVTTIPHVLAAKPQPQADGVLQLDIDVDVDVDVREELAAAIVQAGWGLREMQAATLSLEEIFLELTTEESGIEAESAPSTARVGDGEIVGESAN
ncbi:MAG: MFS transporter [Dehalococcoidia bacterium]|nr:MFS transporter [Dehalococcoidia bacterium]